MSYQELKSIIVPSNNKIIIIIIITRVLAVNKITKSISDCENIQLHKSCCINSNPNIC